MYAKIVRTSTAIAAAIVLLMGWMPIGAAEKTVNHSMGSEANGVIDFECTAYGIGGTIPMEGLTIPTSNGMSVTIVTIWHNTTSVVTNGGSKVQLHEEWDSLTLRHETKGDWLRLAPLTDPDPPTARVEPLPSHDNDGPRVFSLGAETGSLNLGPVATHDIDPFPSVIESGPLGISVPDATSSLVPARMTTISNGIFVPQDQVQLKVSSVTIRDEHATYEVAKDVRTSSVEAGPFVQSSHAYAYATIGPMAANQGLALTSAHAWCNDSRFVGSGTVTFHYASGSVDPPGIDSVEFSNQEVQLLGSMIEVVERVPCENNACASPGDSKIQAQVTGSISEVYVDGRLVRAATARITDTQDSLMPVAAAILLVAASIALPFMTRLSPLEVVGLRPRRQILTLVHRQPGISFDELCLRSSVRPSTIRYHLAILERHHQVQCMVVNRRLRILPEDADPEHVRARLLLEQDEAVSKVVATVAGNGGVPARRVAMDLQRTLKLSRSGSWKVIDRAHKADLIRKEHRNGGMYLSLASRIEPPSS